MRSKPRMEISEKATCFYISIDFAGNIYVAIF